MTYCDFGEMLVSRVLRSEVASSGHPVYPHEFLGGSGPYIRTRLIGVAIEDPA